MNDDRIQQLPDDVLEALTDRYADVHYVSAGATGSVFSAHDKILDIRVAIKVLKNADKKALVFFQREAKAAGKLAHANLVKILDFGITKENNAYLIMEFVEGQSLEGVIDANGPLTLKQAIPLLLQICDGLAHAHAKGIAHRDLKTSNIIVREFESNEPNAVIVDFGLAKELKEQDESQVSSGAVRGSPLYMSPEQAQGKPGNESSDIYSLGCIMYRVLTGRTPFESDELFALLRKHIEEPAPPLDQLTAHETEYPPELQECANHMLAKEPADRFHDVMAVRDALAGIKYGEESEQSAPSQAMPVVSYIIPPSFFSKHRHVFITLVGIIIAIMVSVFFIQTKTIKVKVADPDAVPSPGNFGKYWTVEEGSDFMEFHNLKAIEPESPAQCTDEMLASLQMDKLPCENLSLAYSKKIKGTGFKYLSKSKIKRLELSETNLDRSAYKYIGQMKSLQELSLRKTNVDDEDIKQISELPDLKHIVLTDCKGVSDKSLEHLSRCRMLDCVDLMNTRITDRGLSFLKTCTEMRRLNLQGTAITDDGIIKSLLGFDHLFDIRLTDCPKVTGKSLKAIAERYGKQITFLGISGPGITQKDLVWLDKCRNLQLLSILMIPVEDRDMDMIARMKRLSWLYFSDSKFTMVGLRKLRDLPNLKTVENLRGNLSKSDYIEADRILPKVRVYSLTAESVPPSARQTLDLFLRGDGAAFPEEYMKDSSVEFK